MIVGLGNPGKEYENTSHNAGRNATLLFVKNSAFDPFKEDRKNKTLITSSTLHKKTVLCILPETFMNKSGSALHPLQLSKKAASEKLILIHDDLDLPLGTIKIVRNRGSAGHKGVESIIRAVQTQDFIRIRIGIARPLHLHKSQTEKTVEKIIIGKLPPEDVLLLKKGIKKAAVALGIIAQSGVERAMNELN